MNLKINDSHYQLIAKTHPEDIAQMDIKGERFIGKKESYKDLDIQQEIIIMKLRE